MTYTSNPAPTYLASLAAGHEAHEAFTHLPADIAAALADYDARVASQAITFDSEGFATHHADPMGGWIQANVALHLSVMDSGE